MTPEQWEKISEIYHSALEIDSSERRRAFLETACAEDESLRREVESLLAANSELGDFIAEPVVRDIAPLLTIENTSPSVSLAGKSLGHYRIVSRIGLGGMGEVYLAEDSRLNRRVAVKTLPVSFSSDQNHLRRFQTEAKAAATLNHPNVATIYSVEETDGQRFITMEYVEGKTLDTFIPSGGLDLKTFLEWFIPLADALSHAHEKGIIHRDIKPGNVMITPEGVPKMLDFGLAQIDKTVGATATAAEDSSTLDMTEPGQVFGTPSYMSPEQAEGRQVDHRSDIFSFGVVMYQALTGERPFKGDSYASIVSALMTKEPRPVSEIKPETPFLLSRLVMRCLCKERRKRFQSMREVRAILEEIQATVEAGGSLKSSSLRFLKSKAETSQRAWILAPLVLLAIVAASFALYLFFQDKPQPPLSVENMTLRRVSQTNNVLFAQITPDGKSMVYTSLEENDARALWIRRIEDKTALQLVAPQPVQHWGGITISADGTQIYYITAARDAKHGTLYRISTLGGAQRKLVETVNDLGGLSPDGSRILYIRYGDQRMQLLSANAADGSDERVIYSLPSPAASNYIFRDPQFSLDGKTIFFIKFERIDGEEFWSLVEIPATGGEERVILPLRKPRIGEIVVLKDGSGLLINATDAISNLQQLYHVSLPAGLETRITNDLHTYFGVSISDDGKTLVAVQRNIAKDIWTASVAEANNARLLTNESNVNSNAVWTPDGRIVFDALENNRPHIWIMNGDGTNPQQLTPNDSSDYEPRVSPDGGFIVFTSKRTGETKIWRMNIDGSNPQLLTPVGGAAYGPHITPDGQTVLFQWGKENQKVLGRVPLAGGEIAEEPIYDPNSSLFAISPDNRQVAYAFYDEASRGYKVRLRPLDAKEPSTVFNIAPINFLLWTPDGKNLLYREIEASRSAVSTAWLQPVAGGAPKQFLDTKPDRIFNLSLSADGKQILIVRGRYLTDAVMLTQIREN